jgi:hypothetical protein
VTRDRDETEKNEAVVEGDDHGGELAAWLPRPVSALITWSTLPSMTTVEVTLAGVPTPQPVLTLHGGR